MPSTSASANSVDVDGIAKSFGSVHALDDICFHVGGGEVVALLGPNGAGKSTMLDILATLIKPDRGSARVAGYDVLTDATRVRRAIALTGQTVALDDILTGHENLVMFGRLRGLSRTGAEDRARQLLQEFDLTDAADRRVATYSGGMRRRIDIACGLVVRPRVVFLDEPTTGLDPRSRQAIWALITTFKDAGVATLLTTQYLEEADELSDRIIVLDAGRIVAHGTADALKQRVGGTYCEFVPKNPADVAAIAHALGPLLPENGRSALTFDSERVTIPAPDGLDGLTVALNTLHDADIALADLAVRKPSLDDVFLALTGTTRAGDSEA